MAVVKSEPKKDNTTQEQESKAPVIKPVEVTKDDLTETDRNKVNDLERKQKRRRKLDYIHAIVSGLGGRKITRDELPSVHFQKERDKIFDEYKGLALQNQKTKALWDEKQLAHQQRLDQIAKQKEITPEEKRQFDAEMADKEKNTKARQYANETDRIRANAYKDKLEQSAKSDNPYLDIYYDLDSGSQKLINEIAKLSGAPTDDDGNLKTNLSKDARESYVRDVLGKITEEGEDGSIQFKPNAEEYLSEVRQAIDNFKQAEKRYKDLEYNEDEKESVTDPGWIQRNVFGQEPETTEYGRNLQQAKQDYEQAQQYLNDVMEGPSKSGSKSEKKKSKDNSPLSNILDNL